MTKNYKTYMKRNFGQVVTVVTDLDGRYLGRTFKIDAPGDPWKWIVEIGNDFIEDCVTGLARTYTQRTKAAAVADIAGATREYKA